MSEMTFDRFRRIVDSYGAAPARWPDDEREAAERFMREDPERIAGLLHEAAALDCALAAHLVEPAGGALVGAILTEGPLRRTRRQWWPILRKGGAFAGLGMAGILSGALAVALVLPMAGEADDDDGAVLTAFQSPTAAIDEWDSTR